MHVTFPAPPVPTHMRRGRCTLCGHSFDICPLPAPVTSVLRAHEAVLRRGCPHCHADHRWLVVLGSMFDRELRPEEVAKFTGAA